MKWSKLVQIVLMGILLLIGTLVNSTMAQPRNPLLSDSEEPGSVIVFPKFIRGVVTPPNDSITPKTEFEVGVVCPKDVATGGPGACALAQVVKIHFHYVCGDTFPVTTNGGFCRENDFFASTTVNGKLVLNPEGFVPPGNTVGNLPPCERGYLIGWVVNALNQPIKFDGLIGHAVLRESATSVASYSGIPIQADPALATNALILLEPTTGGLQFGVPGGYQAVTGVIYTDVAYDKLTLPFRRTFLTLLTLDVFSSRPNPPTFVDLRFFNANEIEHSASTTFFCWQEVGLTSIDPNFTAVQIGSRKGVLIAGPAEQPIIFPVPLPFFVPVTLLGIVDTLEGVTGNERMYSYNVFNDNTPVPTLFLPQN
jgi:hypothetical protein